MTANHGLVLTANRDQHRPGVGTESDGTRVMRKRIVLVIVGSVLASGCASILQHRAVPPTDVAQGDCPKYLYSGVETDVRLIGYAFHPRHTPDAVFDPSGLMWIFTPVFLVDIPFSLAIDSVCLPYDACMTTFGGRLRSGRYRVQPNAMIDGILTCNTNLTHDFILNGIHVFDSPDVPEATLLQFVGKEVCVRGECDPNPPFPHISARGCEDASMKK